MAENKQPSTKEKLAAIVNGFDDFDSEMKIGTRQRREQDEFKIADLKNTMTRLDSELIIEIKRRTEMNKSTQMVRLVVSECYCLMKWFQETQSYIKFIRISLLSCHFYRAFFELLNKRITPLLLPKAYANNLFFLLKF